MPNVTNIPTLTTLASAAPSANLTVFLNENGREGLFECVSGTAPADPQRGLYVPSTTSGFYWARVWDGINGQPEWFGAVAGSSAGSIPANNVAAIHACHALCPTTVLRQAEYYVNDTIHFDRSGRKVYGQQAFLRSTIVQTDPAKDVCHIGGYADNNRRDGIEVWNVGVRWATDPVQPPVGSEHLAPKGFRIEYVLAAHVKAAFVESPYIGIWVHGTIYTRIEDFSVNRNKTFGGANDFYKAVWVRGFPLLSGVVGGNASLYLVGKNNVTIGDLNWPVTRPTGVYMDGDIADIYLLSLETSQVNFPIDIDCSLATNYCGDVHIRNVVLDNFKGDGITIKNLPGTALITIDGGFLHCVDSGFNNKCLWLEGGNGQITVSNLQIHGQDTSSTSLGIYALNQPNLVISDTVMINNIAYFAHFENCIRPRMRASINAQSNNSFGTRAALFVKDCSNGTFVPKISGPTNGFSEGVVMAGNNTRVTVDMTEIAADAISGGDKIRVGSNVISAPGFYTPSGAPGSPANIGIEARGFGT